MINWFKGNNTPQKIATNTSVNPEFPFIKPGEIYLDSACQTLRPAPVLSSLEDYYQNYNACGGRVNYAWGRKVDDLVAQTRASVLSRLQLSSSHYTVSFTLNTTYGLNLLLLQLPLNTYKQVVTSEIEHNSVFLSTISLAKRLQIPRIVLPRRQNGELDYHKTQIERAIVVVNVVSNIDGRQLANLQQLIQDVHHAGGIVIIDAAQAMAHHNHLLWSTKADAICFSGHKMYAASLGVIVAKNSLLTQLDISLVGGGMVTKVEKNEYQLIAEEPHAWLEPGLQAWAEIVSLNAALKWLEIQDKQQAKAKLSLHTLSSQLFQGLSAHSGIKLLNQESSNVLSFHSPHIDSHRLAAFLSESGIMVRSGYFCAHYYLKELQNLPPLIRMSLGLHNTSEDVSSALSALHKFVKG